MKEIFQPSATSSHMEDLWVAVRLLAEGSDWKRDQGETITAWVQRKLKATRSETASYVDGMNSMAEEILELMEQNSRDAKHPLEHMMAIRALCERQVKATPSATRSNEMKCASPGCDEEAMYCAGHAYK